MKQMTLLSIILIIFISGCIGFAIKAVNYKPQPKCEPYYYHITLEDTAMVITEHGRFVASVPYEKTGILDSIFIADNE